MCLMIPMQADIGPNAVRDMQAGYTIIGYKTITGNREVFKGLLQFNIAVIMNALVISLLKPLPERAVACRHPNFG